MKTELEIMFNGASVFVKINETPEKVIHLIRFSDSEDPLVRLRDVIVNGEKVPYFTFTPSQIPCVKVREIKESGESK